MHSYYKIGDKIIDVADISVLDMRKIQSTGAINPVIILKNGYKLDFDRYVINSDEYNSFIEIQDFLLDDSNMVNPVCITGEISVSK